MGPHSDVIFHAVGRRVWQTSPDPYEPPSLAAEGFIHFSTGEQILATLNRFHAGRTDLVLLVVATADLPGRLRWEPAVDVDQTFPHLYGPLSKAVVRRVVAIQPGSDGCFTGPLMT